MLNFKPIDIEDRSLLDKYLKPYNFLTCEYSFTNLIIWREGCDIQYCIYKDALIIKKTDFKGNYYFMQPIGYKEEDLKDIVDILTKYSIEHKMKYIFKDIEEPFKDKLNELYNGQLQFDDDRDNFDYIYESSKLATLSGKALHNKKNHYNHFIKNYEFKAVPITEDIKTSCIEFAEEWYKKSKNDSKHLLYELNGIKKLLNNYDKLDLSGVAVYVDNKLSAFTLGEIVNKDMAIVHIEKADPEIDGLYSFINKTFVEEKLSSVKYINREQDLGIEGLRKAKTSYRPLKLEPKFALINPKNN